MVFIVYIIVKIEVFLFLDQKDNKFIEKAYISLNKSKITFKNIKIIIYIHKIFQTLFCIIYWKL